MTQAPASMLGRLLPKQADNRFAGYRAALWLLGLYVALKLVMGFNSIFNTASVATGADGIALNSFGPAAAREVLTLFALTSLGQLTLALIALTILIRYRALVSFIYLVLIGEHLARRAIVQSHALARTDTASTGLYINLGLLALLAIGLALSLLRARSAART
jgi:hypothetical protein